MYTVSHATYRTPRGAPIILNYREGTNDAAMVAGILSEDEYRLRDLYISGWALDIGAHVGTVGLAMAIDNPDLSVVCVEPVPDNAALIRSSIGLNGLADRVFVEEASAGSPGVSTLPCQYAYTAADNPDSGYVEQSRFVGNVFRGAVTATEIESPVVTIRDLSAKYGVTSWSYCKIDCEGCEYAFLDHGGLHIEQIIGEYHDAPPSRIQEVLGPIYEVEILTDLGGIGLFRAVRR